MKGRTLTSRSRSVRTVLAASIAGALALWLFPSGLLATGPSNLDWRSYGNDLHNTRFQDVDRSIRPTPAS